MVNYLTCTRTVAGCRSVGDQGRNKVKKELDESTKKMDPPKNGIKPTMSQAAGSTVRTVVVEEFVSQK